MRFCSKIKAKVLTAGNFIMAINIDKWLNLAIEKLQKTFSEKLLFVGLQGSYNRGEATDKRR